jgi:hypothetical protein
LTAVEQARAWVWLPVQAARVLFFVLLENPFVPVGITNRD